MIGVLFLLLGVLCRAQPLQSTGLRCANQSDCDTQLHAHACKYRYLACLSDYCRGLPAAPCLGAGTPLPCNNRDARCEIKHCRAQADCDQRAYCDGQERCANALCVFVYEAQHCRTLNETCQRNRLCTQPATAAAERFRVATASPTEAPSVAPTTAAPTGPVAPVLPTVAPTSAPTPANVPGYAVGLLAFMFFVFLIAIIIGVLARSASTYTIYSSSAQPLQYAYT